MDLILEQVTKQIKGRTVLDHIDLQLQSGTVYGLVGDNGSGKTMLLRAISGLIRLNEGRILWNGCELHKAFPVIPNQGILIENAGLYPDLSGLQNLMLLAGVNHKIYEKEVREAILRVGLDPDDKKKFRKYSLGMKQRLLIAQAIMEQPDLILLDEPTNALDENGIALVRRIILEEKSRGALILIASHNKDDIRATADTVFRVSCGAVFPEEPS